MKPHHKPNLRFGSSPHNPVVLKTIKEFSRSRRSAIRGIVVETQKMQISVGQINSVRNNFCEKDMVAAAVMLEGPSGLRRRQAKGVIGRDSGNQHHIEIRDPRLEAAYACAFVNQWTTDALSILENVHELAYLDVASPSLSVDMLAKMFHSWGASSYLARKVAFLKERRALDDSSREGLSDLEKKLQEYGGPSIHYAALEASKASISIFAVAKRHASLFTGQPSNGYRRNHYLNTLVATPYSDIDTAGFILRAVETSLVDTVIAILVIYNLRERFETVSGVIRRNLVPTLHRAIETLSQKLEYQDRQACLSGTYCPDFERSISGSDEEEEASLTLYRCSASFLERPAQSRYRNDLDRVVGFRLIASLATSEVTSPAHAFHEKDVLLRKSGVFDFCKHHEQEVELDYFYRTYLFLRFIQEPANLAGLESSEIKFIFNNTESLECLLTERELKEMHLNASSDARALVSVLALALYKNKSADQDIDFDFRKALEDFIYREYSGKILGFIESIIPASPNIAKYIADVLDESTLQRMYSLVESPVAAGSIRRDMLMAIGVALNRIDYVIEAESIETRSKVAKLREYFDSSRMYVDSTAMKKWLISNPSAPLEEYKKQLHDISRDAMRATRLGSPGVEKRAQIRDIRYMQESIVEQVTSDAFAVFCENNEFGIESYLARRIRHNTLHGVMTSSVHDVLRKPEHAPIVSGTPFGRALSAWEQDYKLQIELMRRELLQFKSDTKPNALFNSSIDFSDAVSKRNVEQFIQAVRISGPELIHELIISFCWQQVAPQLSATARYIKVSQVRAITQGLENALARFMSAEEVKVKAELSAVLSSVLHQVAGWFQIPHTGFVPASISEICNIIDIELGKTGCSTRVLGDQLSQKYLGISVHRIYDCLAVLLHNAYKHGREESGVVVTVGSRDLGVGNMHLLEICVVSGLPRDSAMDCIDRVCAAVDGCESSADLVTEGYSGIKKVKVITRMNEGESTVHYEASDSEIRIGFRIKAEVDFTEPTIDESSFG